MAHDVSTKLCFGEAKKLADQVLHTMQSHDQQVLEGA